MLVRGKFFPSSLRDLTSEFGRSIIPLFDLGRRISVKQFWEAKLPEKKAQPSGQVSPPLNSGRTGYDCNQASAKPSESTLRSGTVSVRLEPTGCRNPSRSLLAFFSPCFFRSAANVKLVCVIGKLDPSSPTDTSYHTENTNAIVITNHNTFAEKHRRMNAKHLTDFLVVVSKYSEEKRGVASYVLIGSST